MLKDVMTEHGLEPEQVASESAALERDGPTERAQRLARSAARRAKKSYDEAGAPKPERLGRGVSARLVRAAAEGEPIGRKGRMKITRAVNACLTRKGADTMEGEKLFADAPRPKAKS